MYKHDEKMENLTKMEQIKTNIIIGLSFRAITTAFPSLSCTETATTEAMPL